jgi:hypothetical protein
MASYTRSQIANLLEGQREANAENAKHFGWDEKTNASMLDAFTLKIRGWSGGETHTLTINGDQLFRIADILAEND